MSVLTDARLNRARELLQAGREGLARAEEAKGRDAVAGLMNSCGQGWFALFEAVKAHCISQGVPEPELPADGRRLRPWVKRYMSRELQLRYAGLWATFYLDGYQGGIVEFDEMPGQFDELAEFIGQIEDGIQGRLRPAANGGGV